MIQAINEPLLAQLDLSQTQVLILRSDELEIEAELDEMWSFVQSKENQRWLWWAIDHQTGEVLAFIHLARKHMSRTLPLHRNSLFK
jgi:insertion element IS1 protein InsB